MQAISRLLAQLTASGVLYTINFTRHRRPTVNITINSGPGAPFTVSIRGIGN